MFDHDPNRPDDRLEHVAKRPFAAFSLMALAVLLAAAWCYFALTQGFDGPGH